MSGTGHGVDTLLSIQPRGTTIIEDGRVIAISPESILVGRVVRVGTNRHMPLSKMVLSRITTFGATTLAKRDIPQSVDEKRRMLTNVVIASGMVQVGIAGPFSGDTLTHVLRLMRSTSRHGTPTRLFVEGFTHICAPVIVNFTFLVILVPCVCSFVGPLFKFIFGS